MANSRSAQNGFPSRRAEIAGEYLHKGSRVYLDGRKRTESWGDKKTGTKNYRDLVFADRIEFLDSRSNGIGESMPDESAEEHNTSSDDVPL
jgi:single-strand DNA-binding protein